MLFISKFMPQNNSQPTNSKLLILLAIIIVILVLVFCAVIYLINQNNINLIKSNSTSSSQAMSQLQTSNSSNSTQAVSTNSISSVTTTSVVSSMSQVSLNSNSITWENQYMKMTIPSGWKETVTSDGNAINLIKGNYILYVNSYFSPAAGVVGWRLYNGIGSGAPSFDAVVKSWDSTGCGDNIFGSTESYRSDNYISPSSDKIYCNLPSTGEHWYFSFILPMSSEKALKFYDLTNSPHSYVVTMSYNSKDINSFPLKGSTELNQTLNEMTDIVKTIQIK